MTRIWAERSLSILSSITEVTAQPNNRFGVYKWETPEDIQVGDTGREGTYKKLFRRRRNETEVVFLLPIPKVLSSRSLLLVLTLPIYLADVATSVTLEFLMTPNPKLELGTRWIDWEVSYGHPWAHYQVRA
jgi:hypothetical protein